MKIRWLLQMPFDHVLLTQELIAADTSSVTIQGTDRRALLATLALQ